MNEKPVQFFFEKQFALSERTRLREFIVSIFRKEKVPFKHLNYIFCSDQALLDINRQFLQHDYETDVITFPMSEKNEPVEGEIYISIDRVRDNARTLGVPVKHELHRVIFHGALHLCGFRDKTKTQVTLIRAREDHYLRLFFK
ncbi:MAG: rRNA maturation RNase YbeY [Chitinophagaceae bacterium]|nr:MAG: rRNA maturation RNase YbeY [Chitinophagaceae bacterium]